MSRSSWSTIGISWPHVVMEGWIMSTRRELLWFKSDPTRHWTTTMAAEALVVRSITANSTNSVVVEPTWAWAGLRGTIEALVVKSKVARAMSIVFFSSASAGASTVASDRTIDYHVVQTTHFTTYGSATVLVASFNNLAIPYWDKQGTKKFHIGIEPKTAAISSTDD